MISLISFSVSTFLSTWLFFLLFSWLPLPGSLSCFVTVCMWPQKSSVGVINGQPLLGDLDKGLSLKLSGFCSLIMRLKGGDWWAPFQGTCDQALDQVPRRSWWAALLGSTWWLWLLCDWHKCHSFLPSQWVLRWIGEPHQPLLRTLSFKNKQKQG